MENPTKAPYGTWKSPLEPETVAQSSVAIGAVEIGDEGIFWLEGRPQEGGRYALVQMDREGNFHDLIPAPYNVRTRVQEYGGGALLISGRTVFFSNFADNRVYQMELGEAPKPLTPQGKFLYADFVLSADRKFLLAVAEDHTNEKAVETLLVAIELATQTVTPLAQGHDFYASPTLSPDGKKLAWVTWDHPNLPWDNTELWCADYDNGKLGPITKIAGNGNESICEPRFSPKNELFYVSDRSNWWNLYRDDENILPIEAEFSYPAWQLGEASYAFTPQGKIVALYFEKGATELVEIDPESKTEKLLSNQFSEIFQLKLHRNEIALIAATDSHPNEVVVYDRDRSTSFRVKASKQALDGESISVPQPIGFKTAHDEQAYGYYYAPKNSKYLPIDGEKPPLIVMIHGGPTARASTAFNPKVQFWTTRGFAVVDVDYRGSLGYGREYRRRLLGEWGIADVEDCVHAVKALSSIGLADETRLAIRGGSAGGFTVLASIAFHQVFTAAACYYGVSDLEKLTQETHKFESRYLDGLIGPYPAEKTKYLERSPIHSIEKMNCPLIVFQGLEDKVVPPNQSEMIVERLKARGIRVEYHAFEGEQHGFRIAKNQATCLREELAFYQSVWKIAP